MDENERFVGELKQKHSIICSALEVKRKVFDRQLRRKHQTKEKPQEEWKVSASCVTVNSCLAKFSFTVLDKVLLIECMQE